MKRKGKLIVIDGADGAGKATQVELLGDRLRREGFSVKQLDFPRYKDNFFGTFLRECLDGTHGDFLSVHPKIASTLYAADRFESKTQIEEWLSEGAVVILDRYVSANMLHQGSKIADSAELTDFLSWLDQMEHDVFQIPRPDAIIYLDVPFAVRDSLMRADTSRDGKDTVDHDRAYQEASEACAQNIIKAGNTWEQVVCTEGDTLKEKEHIHEEVYTKVRGLLKELVS